MVYVYFKDLTRRTASEKILHDKAFSIVKNPKYDGHNCVTSSMVYNFFDEKVSATRANKFADGGIKNENMLDWQLAKELHKPIIKIFKKTKVQSPFIDNILGAHFPDTQLIRKFNKKIRFLLCVMDISRKYAWFVPLKDKRSITIAFPKILKESNRKPNKMWVDKGSEFFNKPMKSWLEKNSIAFKIIIIIIIIIKMYSTHNEGKSVVAESFMRTLKNKIFKYMTSISKNICIDKLDEIVNS